MNSIFHQAIRVTVSVEYSDDQYVNELNRFSIECIKHIINCFDGMYINEMLWNSVTIPREDFIEVTTTYIETDDQHTVEPLFFRMCFDVSVMCYYFDGEVDKKDAWRYK